VRNTLVDIRRIGPMGEGGLSCRRVQLHRETASDSHIICFLPWLFSYARSADAGLIPPGCLLAYEMPHAIVSPSPDKSVDALHVIVDDFLTMMNKLQLDPDKLILVGLSIGNFAATYIANKIGARLWSVAAGDRGEVLVWNSSLATGIRAQAESSGLRFDDFEKTLSPFNPINNLENIGGRSIFISGYFDTVVPYRCARNVALAARTRNRTARRFVLPLGHSETLVAGVRCLRFMTRVSAATVQITTPQSNSPEGQPRNVPISQ
jgi:pimeloyl-ACP methyl ester carboxylesterase